MRNFILAIAGIVIGTVAHAEILIGFGAPLWMVGKEPS